MSRLSWREAGGRGRICFCFRVAMLPVIYIHLIRAKLVRDVTERLQPQERMSTEHSQSTTHHHCRTTTFNLFCFYLSRRRVWASLCSTYLIDRIATHKGFPAYNERIPTKQGYL
jgi:hypothetical protein